MGWRAGVAVALVGIGFALGGGFSGAAPSDLDEAIRILGTVPSGSRLLRAGVTRWKVAEPSQLRRVFRWGKVSRTDAVLIRNYDPDTGQETREREVTIRLRSGQKLEDLVLDVAHELTHALAEPGWDPYDPELTAGRYIWAAIEGTGGEVDALLTECTIAFELAARHGFSLKRCKPYRDTETGIIDRDRVRQDFYRVGEWSSELRKRLGSEHRKFPFLSDASPALFSSTGQAPYPVALLEEFNELTRVACENSRARLAAREGSRSPASLEKVSEPALRKSAARFLELRCSRS